MTARAPFQPTPYLFLLPAMVVTLAVVLIPVAQTVWMSLHDYVLFRPKNIPFIGLGNFVRMLGDETFWISLGNSIWWIALVVGGQFLLGFAAALLLNQSFWWRGVARALMIVPWALPSVIIGLTWTWMYDFNVGVLNDALLRFGFIANPTTAFYAIVLALIWQGFPFFAVTILAGLQTIGDELYEAADIDGANRWQRLRYVIWPALADVVATALLLRTIWVANSLDVILVMTGGGPGLATHTLPLYSFLKAYAGMEFGYAGALAIMLTILLMAVVIVYVRRQARELAS